MPMTSSKRVQSLQRKENEFRDDIDGNLKNNSLAKHLKPFSFCALLSIVSIEFCTELLSFGIRIEFYHFVQILPPNRAQSFSQARAEFQIVVRAVAIISIGTLLCGMESATPCGCDKSVASTDRRRAGKFAAVAIYVFLGIPTGVLVTVVEETNNFTIPHSFRHGRQIVAGRFCSTCLIGR